jgi:hypothetical protein
MSKKTKPGSKPTSATVFLNPEPITIKAGPEIFKPAQAPLLLKYFSFFRIYGRLRTYA